MLKANLLKLRKHNHTFSVLVHEFKNYTTLKNKINSTNDLNVAVERLGKVLNKWSPRLIYNSLIDKQALSKKYQKEESPALQGYKKEVERLKQELGSSEPVPITLKYLDSEINRRNHEKLTRNDENAEVNEVTHFPFDAGYKVQASHQTVDNQDDKMIVKKDFGTKLEEEVRQRYEFQHEVKNWMTAYDNYDDSRLEEDETGLELNSINYGTPNPNSKISKTSCGGCGALLHCKDTAIPGYIPSEIFSKVHTHGGASLSAITCQRCHFLKNYNLALQIQVTPDDYPKVLQTISQKQGIVILMVDLLDFPCSIWPGIGEIFSNKTPIIVVGNKVDLLPKDDGKYLKTIKKRLSDYVKLSGFATFNIKNTVLISAKTGFGVEDLITALSSLYNYNGDFYIVGSTNVGKSSLFNILLQSDFCKSQATDLIQRATTSIWPGTTLNLLKFPIKRPSGYRQHLRHKRLVSLKRFEEEEAKLRQDQLRKTRNPEFATLIGHIDVTRNPHLEVDETKDNFSLVAHKNASGRRKLGINESDPAFRYSKWCFDTPGVVQPDQIINILTTEELVLTLPRTLISPRTFCLKPASSLFIGGLSRLDYVEGGGSVRLTVFASDQLPITISKLEDADEMYEELLGTPLLKVPKGGHDRLEKWPKLERAKEFSVEGVNWKESATDVVLSSSGWIAITGRPGMKYDFQAWTPEKRGFYVRDALLPKAVALVGQRIKYSVAYNKHKFYLREN